MKGLAYQGVSQQAGASTLRERETLTGIAEKGFGFIKTSKDLGDITGSADKPAETNCKDVINVLNNNSRVKGVMGGAQDRMQ